MWWQDLDPRAQSILLNFQELMRECILKTQPDPDYYAETVQGDFYFLSQILFPLMNGVLSFAQEPTELQSKLEALKTRFQGKNYPLTWFWPHDRELPPQVETLFKRYGFQSLGHYASVGVEVDQLKASLRPTNLKISIERVERKEQFQTFMQISQEVYGVSPDSLPAMTRLYGAYKNSDKLRFYLAALENKPVSILLSFQHQKTLGLYNGATLEAYRKQGLLSALVTRAIQEAPTADFVVAQLMAAQNAKGVCQELGAKEYAHFIPLCQGFDLSALSA